MSQRLLSPLRALPTKLVLFAILATAAGAFVSVSSDAACVIDTPDLYNQYKAASQIFDARLPNGSWNVNNSSPCVVRVHLSIWKVNQGGDLLYRAQTLFSNSGVRDIQPGQVINIDSPKPGCWYQTDLGAGDGYFNDVAGEIIQNGNLCTAAEGAVCTSVNAPATVLPGQQFTVSMTMQNTGDSHWYDLGLSPYRLGTKNPLDNATFGAARIGVSGVVVPGQSTNFSFTATAPTALGTYNMEWEMLRENLYRFGSSCQKNITVIAPVSNSTCSVSAPATVQGNSQFNATFTLTNNGTTTWKAGPHSVVGNYLIMSKDPIDNGTWGTARIALPHDVAPGQTVTVNATMTAPLTVGDQLFSFEMGNEGVGRFGQSCQKTINITPMTPNCVIDTAALYKQYQNQGKISHQVQSNGSWTVVNGTTCTIKAHVTIWKVNENGANLYKAQTIFSSSGLKEIQPGQTLNISSSTPGCQYQTDLGGGEGPFDDIDGVIQGSPTCTQNNNATCSVTAPDTVTPGQQFTATFNLNNNGDSWWFNEGLAPYRLSSVNPNDNTTFGPSRIGINGFVKPGESQTLTLNATAPTAAGTYNLDWQMNREGLYRFGAVCHKSITVANSASSSSSSSSSVRSSSSSSVSSSSSSAAAPQCRDGADNDNDTKIDAQDPSCHFDGNVNNNNSYEQDFNNEARTFGTCLDNQDNDNDGKTDALDPDCHTDGNPNNNQSFDARRNEVNGPSSSSSSSSSSSVASSSSSSSVSSSSSSSLSSSSSSSSRSSSSSSVSSSSSSSSSSMSSSSSSVSSSSSSSSSSATAQCRDGVDNDNDAKIDAQDPGCHSDGNVNNSNTYEPDFNNESRTFGTCLDNQDNDNDGKTDALDPDCHTDGNPNNNQSFDARRNESATATEQCRDNVDNDGDGKVDAQDPGCHFDGNASNQQSYNPYRSSEADGQLAYNPFTGSVTVVNNNTIASNANANANANPNASANANPNVAANPTTYVASLGGTGGGSNGGGGNKDYGSIQYIALLPQTGIASFTGALGSAQGMLTPITGAAGASSFLATMLGMLGLTAGGGIGRRLF